MRVILSLSLRVPVKPDLVKTSDHKINFFLDYLVKKIDQKLILI